MGQGPGSVAVSDRCVPERPSGQAARGSGPLPQRPDGVGTGAVATAPDARDRASHTPASHCAFLIESYEQEQGQVASDLHDGIGQMLGAMKYQVEGAIEKVKAGDAAAACVALSQVVTRVQDAIQEVRRIAMRLRPSILDDLGLLPTIEWFVRDFRATYASAGLATEVSVRVQEGEVPERLKLVLYRVLQEALHNVVKHAQAREVRVDLARADGALTLRVADDGRGFDATALPVRAVAGGLGLDGMRVRVEQAGGVFSVQSVPGGGTQVVACWPAAAASAGDQAVLDGVGGEG